MRLLDCYNMLIFKTFKEHRLSQAYHKYTETLQLLADLQEFR